MSDLNTEDFTQPSQLPVGVEEFHKWSESIVAKSGLPNNESMKNTLASMIIQLPSHVAQIPKQHFVDCLLKAAATQVAFEFRQQYNEKKQAQKEASKSSETSTEAAATTTPSAQG